MSRKFLTLIIFFVLFGIFLGMNLSSSPGGLEIFGTHLRMEGAYGHPASLEDGHPTLNLYQEWTCSNGLFCNYTCGGTSYQLIWGDDPDYDEYTFTAPQKGKYTCKINITTCCFGYEEEDNPEYNETAEVYVNEEYIGTTEDTWCPPSLWEQGEGGFVMPGFLSSRDTVDFVVVDSKGFTAYDISGNMMWYHKVTTGYHGTKNRNLDGVPWYSSYGVMCDLNNDGDTEFVYADKDGRKIQVLNGQTGSLKESIPLSDYGISGKFYNVACGRFSNKDHQGRYPNDIVLVDYKWGVKSPVNVLAINGRTKEKIWSGNVPDQYYVHYGVMRVADVNSDGYDDVAVCRKAFNGHNGNTLWTIGNSKYHNTVELADFVSGNNGLEQIANGYARVDFHAAGVGYAKNYNLPRGAHTALAGEFDLSHPGKEALIRPNNKPSEGCPCGGECDWWDVRRHMISKVDTGHTIRLPMLDTTWKNEKEDCYPWGGCYDFPAEGCPVAEYPRPIDWDGQGTDEILAVERHTDSPLASVHKLDGSRIMETSVRSKGEANVRAFDCLGDGREEIIVLSSSNKVKVYSNGNGEGNVPKKRDDVSYLLSRQIGNCIYNAPL